MNIDPSREKCPCGTGFSFIGCCEPFVNGQTFAPTAATLMRSRYSAYTLQNEAYLLGTWHKDTRPPRVPFDPQCRWLGLKLVHTEAGEIGDGHGVVEFIARYKVAGRAHRLHEVSRFLFESGRWYYSDGLVS